MDEDTVTFQASDKSGAVLTLFAVQEWLDVTCAGGGGGVRGLVRIFSGDGREFIRVRQGEYRPYGTGETFFSDSPAAP